MFNSLGFVELAFTSDMLIPSIYGYYASSENLSIEKISSNYLWASRPDLGICVHTHDVSERPLSCVHQGNSARALFGPVNRLRRDSKRSLPYTTSYISRAKPEASLANVLNPNWPSQRGGLQWISIHQTRIYTCKEPLVSNGLRTTTVDLPFPIVVVLCSLFDCSLSFRFVIGIHRLVR